MGLPVTRWEQNSRKWITEQGGTYKKMKLPTLSGSRQETVTISKEGNTECKNCGEMFEVWGTNKKAAPSFCSFTCMKYWLDYHIDNKDASAGGMKRRKSSMMIPANSKLPIIKWDGSTRNWVITNTTIDITVADIMAA